MMDATDVITLPESTTDEKTRRQPRYNVILIDDDEHSYDYVIRMLRALFGYTEERSYCLASEVDNSGRVIVLTTTLEHAELKRDQIHSFGADPLIDSCVGSMTAVLEPVPA